MDVLCEGGGDGWLWGYDGFGSAEERLGEVVKFPGGLVVLLWVGRVDWGVEGCRHQILYTMGA